jgi:hypothetical protein
MEKLTQRYNSFFSQDQRERFEHILRPKLRIVEDQTSSNDDGFDALKLVVSTDRELRLKMTACAVEINDRTILGSCGHIRVDILARWRNSAALHHPWEAVLHNLWEAIVPYTSNGDGVSIEDFDRDRHRDAEPDANAAWWGEIQVWDDGADGPRVDVLFNPIVTQRILIQHLRYVNSIIAMYRFMRGHAGRMRRPNSTIYANAITINALASTISLELDDTLRRAFDGILFQYRNLNLIPLDTLPLSGELIAFVANLSRRTNAAFAERLIKKCFSLGKTLVDIIGMKDHWRKEHPASYDSRLTREFNNSIARDRWLSVRLELEDDGNANRPNNVYISYKAVLANTTCGDMMRSITTHSITNLDTYLENHAVILENTYVRIDNSIVLNELPIPEDNETLEFKEQETREWRAPTSYNVSIIIPTRNTTFITQVNDSDLDVEYLRRLAFFDEFSRDNIEYRADRFIMYSFMPPYKLPADATVGELVSYDPRGLKIVMLDVLWEEDPAFIGAL